MYACNHESKQNSELRTKLLDQIKYTIQKDTTLIFRLDTLTNFEWDYFMVLSPYTDVDNLSDQINIDLREIRKTGIKHADNKTILVFI
ncbi:MAG: hypothetical protein ACR2GN_08475, partial [Bacteroidia bacterium]